MTSGSGRGRSGTLQGEALREVFDAFCDAEYHFDRDEATARLGGARSVVTDLGRRGRLFTGSIREAASLQAAIDARDRCVYPGCRHRPRQIDHSKPFGQGGATRLVNAGGCCAQHNLFKQRGDAIRRDEHGRWHTYRPDGTELAPT